ncbi:MAG: hypothetical protein PHG05_01980 [Candidatus Nanoarchaeia archaeon]|nr:hypothetical protein [Candidatus Nanoarchaeia archaeon]
MKKRGDLQLFAVFSILIAIIVVGALGYYVSTFKNSRYIERRTATIDIALMVDTLYLCRDSKLVYNINKGDDISIGGGYVRAGVFKFDYSTGTKKLNWKQNEENFEVSS